MQFLLVQYYSYLAMST